MEGTEAQSLKFYTFDWIYVSGWMIKMNKVRAQEIFESYN